MEIGIGLAVAGALMTNLASLLKHRGCQNARSVSSGRPLSGLRDLASSRWFVAGWLLAALAWLAHVAALSVAPISGFEGGLVLLAAGIALGHRAERFASRRGVLRAVLAGLLFALAGIAIKAVLGGSGGGGGGGRRGRG